MGPAAVAGSTSSGKLPAEAATSAGWPAASQPPSPPQSVSWVKGRETKESRGFKTNIMFLFMAIVHSIDLYHVPERFSSVLCFNKETVGFSPPSFLCFLKRHDM